MSKRMVPDRPFVFWGKLRLEFFNNDDENLKRRSLQSLVKESRRELHLSCLSVEENRIENPEKGTLIFSFCAKNQEEGNLHLQKVLAYFDQNAPARIVSEEIEHTTIE